MIACFTALRQDEILHKIQHGLDLPSQFVSLCSSRGLFICKGMCEDPAGPRKQEAEKFQIHVEIETKTL